MASDDAVLARLFFYDNPEYKRHPNYTKTDQLPISEVITGLPRPYHHNMPHVYISGIKAHKITHTHMYAMPTHA